MPAESSRNPKTAIFVHGAFDPNGERHVDVFAPYFEKAGYRVIRDFDYGWTGAISAILFNNRWARLLKLATPPGAVFVGHSNGCAIGWKAAWMGARFSQMVLLNPALDRGARFPAHVHKVHVLYSPSEIPTALSRFIPFSPWGDMGKRGPAYHDPQVLSYNKERISVHSMRSTGHADMFYEPKRDYWGRVVVRVVEEHASF